MGDKKMRWDFKYIDAKICKHHPVHYPKAYKYAKAMEQGVKFPPVKIYIDKEGIHRVQDGAHRTMAAKLTNLPLFIKIVEQYDHRSDIERKYGDMPTRSNIQGR